MSEQSDVIGLLREARVLDGIQWAFDSAVSLTMDTYSEQDGHDAATLGSLKFAHFRDRLDRVFSCGRYGTGDGDQDANLDLLFASLPDRDVVSMPALGPSLVTRSDLKGSPGWLYQDCRFLLASAPYGKVDRIAWPQKSPTKQQVAQQRDPDPAPSLFDAFDPDEVGGLTELVHLTEPDVRTFVVGHSLDPLTRRMELVFGRTRLAEVRGESSWRWSENLLVLSPVGGGRRLDDAPHSNAPDTTADAPVRLRRGAIEKKHIEDEK